MVRGSLKIEPLLSNVGGRPSATRGFGYLATIVIATGLANVMGSLDFTAVGALHMCPKRKPVVRTTLVAPRFGDLLLGYRH